MGYFLIDREPRGQGASERASYSGKISLQPQDGMALTRTMLVSICLDRRARDGRPSGGMHYSLGNAEADPNCHWGGAGDGLGGARGCSGGQISTERSRIGPGCCIAPRRHTLSKMDILTSATKPSVSEASVSRQNSCPLFNVGPKMKVHNTSTMATRPHP